MNQTTAILVFAYSAKEELKHKPIKGGEHLFEELTKQTLQLVQKTGVPYFLYTEVEQKGASFGERFSNAIQEVFNLGYQNIITIGNDTPTLRLEHLQKCIDHLQQKKCVLGTATDGGFYMMGLHKSLFDKNQFEQMPWQTINLANHIIDFVKKQQVQISILQTLQDIDNLEDVYTIYEYESNRISKTLHRLLLDLLLLTKNKANTLPSTITKDNYSFLSYNKGSPLPVFS